MSGVLHPVGPEPPQVYWVRRVIVFAAAVLALVLVIAVVANLNSAASATGPEAVPAAAVSTSSTDPSAGAADSTVPSTSASASASSSATTPSAEPTLSVMASSASAKDSASARPSTKSTASSSTSAGPHTQKSSPAAVTACDPAQLRQTLTGTQRVTAKSKTPLSLSLINGGPSTCQLRLSPDNFVLTIYSGKDRIWSSADCADLVKPTTVKIASQAAYEWQIVWNGLRSKKSCQSRPEIPRPGTYLATAQFTGADPVRLRMFLVK